MRINEIYIENFGKLSKFSARLGGGMNSIVFPNGYGKTTLSYFIKAMFYGLDDGRHRSIQDSDRRRFTPWQGGAFGGSLSFSVGESSYRIERFFGAKAAEDSFTLYDGVGRICTDYSDKIGYELFGIDDEGFERTLFLSDKNLSGETDNTTISAKLSDLAGVDGDINGMDNAIKVLEKQSKVYKKRGGKGEIAELEARLFEAEREISETRAIASGIPMLEEELAALDGRISDIAKRRSQLLTSALAEEKRASQRALYQRYEAQLSGVRAADAALGEVRGFFEKHLPTDGEIDKNRDKLIRASELNRTALAIEGTEPVSREELSMPKKPAMARGVSICLILTVIFGALCFINPLFIIGAAISLFAVFYCLTERQRYSAALREFLRKEKEKSAEGEARDKRAAILKEAETAAGEAREFLSLFPLAAVSDMEKFDELRRMKRLYDSRREAYERLSAEAKEFEKSHLPRTAEGEAAAEPDAKEKLYAIDAENNALIRERSALVMKITDATERAELLDEITERREEYLEKIASYKKRHELIEKTLAHLRCAKDNMTARYLDGARASFIKYSSLISGNGGEFTMDTSFAVRKTEAGALRDTEAFSLGERELYALSLRLALIDALYGNRIPPVILDDPFVHFDDERCTRALTLTRALAETRQIIYMTCSSSRK